LTHLCVFVLACQMALCSPLCPMLLHLCHRCFPCACLEVHTITSLCLVINKESDEHALILRCPVACHAGSLRAGQLFPASRWSAIDNHCLFFPFFVFFLPFAVGNDGRVVVQVAGSIAKWWCEGESSTRCRSRSGVAQQLSDYKGMSQIVTLENKERISVTEWPVRF